MNIPHITPIVNGGRANFIHSVDASGFQWEDRPLGLRNFRHKVAVFDETKHAHSVFFSADAGGMAMHESLTVDESRLLAVALLLAANHAERQNAKVPA